MATDRSQPNTGTTKQNLIKAIFLINLHVVLYTESIMINYSQENLQFFYQKKPGVFDKDSSNEVPDPLRSL